MADPSAKVTQGKLEQGMNEERIHVSCHMISATEYMNQLHEDVESQSRGLPVYTKVAVEDAKVAEKHKPE